MSSLKKINVPERGKSSGTVLRGRLFRKRVSLSLGLGVLIFLVLSYNLTYPAEGEVTSAYESILFRFGTYGFSGNLYTLGIALLLYLWFSFYGERDLFFSKSLTVLSIMFGLLNAAAIHLFYRNTLLWHAASAMLLFLLQLRNTDCLLWQVKALRAPDMCVLHIALTMR